MAETNKFLTYEGLQYYHEKLSVELLNKLQNYDPYTERLTSLRDMGNLHGDGSVLIYPAFGTIDYPEREVSLEWDGALETSTYFYCWDDTIQDRIYFVTAESRNTAVVFAVPRGYTYIVGQHIADTGKIRHIIVPNTVTKIVTGNPIFFFNAGSIDFVPSIDLSDFTDGKPFPTYSSSSGGLTMVNPSATAPGVWELIPCTIYVAKGRKAELAAMTAWCNYADYIVEV